MFPQRTDPDEYALGSNFNNHACVYIQSSDQTTKDEREVSWYTTLEIVDPGTCRGFSSKFETNIEDLNMSITQERHVCTFAGNG